MPEELPDIVQQFVADVVRYVSGLEEAIAADEQFVDKNREALLSVEALQAAIDSLEGRTVRVDVDVNYPGRIATIADIIGGSSTGALERYFAVGEEGIAVERSLERELVSANNAMYEQSAASRALADARRQLADAGREVGLGDEEMARLAAVSGNALFRQGEEAVTKVDKLRALTDIYDVVSAGEERQVWAINAVAVAMAQAGAATANAAATADNGFRIWGTGIRLTGYGLHWLIAGSMELLAVLVPAIIAAGAGVGAAMEGATWAMDRMKATFTATEATASMLGETAGQVYGLKDALQQAQTQADPQVFELLGAGVNAARESFKGFWQSGVQVIDMLDRFGAELDIELAGALGGQLQDAISHMVQDLAALGEVLGNVGHFILNLAVDMPGLAEVLLGVLAGFTRLLSVLTQPAWYNFHGSLLMMIIGLEEAGRWGGLLLRVLGPMVSVFGRLMGVVGASVGMWGEAGSAISNMGVAAAGAGARIEGMGAGMSAAGNMTRTLAGTFRMLFTTGWGWAIIGTGVLIGLAIAMASVQSEAQKTVSTMEDAIGGATLEKALSLSLQDLPKLQTAYQDATAELNDYISQQQRLSAAYDQAARSSAGYAATAAGMHQQLALREQTVLTTQAAAAQQAYQAGMTQVAEGIGRILSVSVSYKGVTYGLAQSIGLATAAGVKEGQMFNQNGQISQIALQMIYNLIQGYQNMGQVGGTLAGDISAINVQTLIQQTRVQQLNQAWDSFMQGLTGGTSSLGALNTELATIGNVTLPQATSKIQAFSQGKNGMALDVSQVAQALRGFGGTSAQVWQNYDAAVSQAQQVTDWLRIAAAEGGVTAVQYTNSIKGVVAELLPFARDSKTATAILSGLAQQATGTSMNYQQLTQWVGNTKQAQQDLNSTVQSATQYMSNLNAVAANLSTTLSTAVDNAIAQGSVNLKGITTATQQFTTAVQQNGLNTMITQAHLIQWVKEMYNANVGANNAKAIISQLGHNMHLTAGQVSGLTTEVFNLYNAIANLHDKTVNINVNTQYTTTGVPVQGGGHIVGPGPHPGMARGGRIPGYGGGDRHLALLEGGEAVVPKHLVAGVAPYLSAHGVPGFAAGGVVHGGHGSGGGLTPMEKIMQLWGREVWRQELHRYGRHSPIALKEMEKLFSGTDPRHGGFWNNPQYRMLEATERRDMSLYHSRDVEYWKDIARRHALSSSQHSQIAKMEKEVAAARKNDSLREAERLTTQKDRLEKNYWKLTDQIDALEKSGNTKAAARLIKERANINAEENSLSSRIRTIDRNYALVHNFPAWLAKLKSTDAEKFRAYTDMADALAKSMGYSRGGLVPFGHYDRGGYLPTGLSMALNTTGRPEPVGHGPSGPVHIHLEIGGKQIAEAILPDLVSSVNRYTYRNSGRATGVLRPS